MDNWKIDNSNTLFNAKTCNNRGQITGYSLGNQLTTTRGYNDFGMPTLISTPGIQNLQYDFDILTGNLNSREDVLKGLQEVFTYDPTLKNRLETWKVNTATADTVLYEANGNIDKKSGLGSYTYGSGRPHAVTEIENTGNVVSEIPDTIAYTPFNKVEIIEEGDYRLVFTYGPDNSRKKTDLYKLRNKKWNWQKTKYFVSGGYELEVEGVQQYERHLNYIYGGDGLAAIFEMDRSNPNLYYIHKDHLGSYQSVTNNNGTLVDKYSFGPWGARRDTTDWSLTNVPTEFLFDRGFTGHEHLDEFNLINMNGRVYDPILGRFLSPDNYIQMPDYTQNLNRYSYALNNPLIYTDPTGEFIWPWLAAMAGNYLIGGADRWVNKGMSFNDAFFNKNYVTAGAGVTFSPSNQRFSHPQVTQGIIANQTGLLSQQLDETIASFSGLGRDVGDWFFDPLDNVLCMARLGICDSRQMDYTRRNWGYATGSPPDIRVDASRWCR